MATKLQTAAGKNPVAGDSLQMDFTFTSVPSGTSFSKLWVTFKRRRTDVDASAIVAPTITSGFSGTTTVTCSVSLTHTQTLLFTPGIKYFWDVQVLTAAGAIATPIADGEVVWQQQTTIATA